MTNDVIHAIINSEIKGSNPTKELNAMSIVIVLLVLLSVCLIGGMVFSIIMMNSTPKTDLLWWELQDKVRNFFKK